MGRLLVTAFLILIVGTVLLLVVFAKAEHSLPVLTLQPGGISQSTVSEVRIPRAGLLSRDRKRVWVKARVGSDSSRDAAILVNLQTGGSDCMIEGGEPMGWLGPSRVLLNQHVMEDPVWKKLVRKFGGSLARVHCTRFCVLDLDAGTTTQLTGVQTESILMFCSISPDFRWLVATWGPTECREISLETGTVSARVQEKYVWSPCFIDNETYVFVGETSLQSRKVGGMSSERASQPLLQEIRDSIKSKGTPSIELCGRINGTIYVVDHGFDRLYDRLLKLDERTRILHEVAQLAPSRSLPDFTPEGHYLAYQGNPFDRTQDTVYFQELAEGSKPEVLIQGISGQVNEANPVFLAENQVLYVHRGTELRSVATDENQPVLHWPQSLLP